MSQRVLCIWLPNWPSQRVAAAASPAESSSAAVPRVLYSNDARRGRIVAAANATARKAGVIPAMTLAQLVALCPDAKWEEHDANADLEALISLAEQLHSFSPIVGLEELDAHAWAGRSLRQPQSIGIDIDGISTWFGGELAMAQLLQQWLIHRGYIATIGIADTLGAAWAIANYAFRNQIASAMETFESTGKQEESLTWIGILPPGASQEDFFANYPIEALRLEPDVVAKLHRLGIRTMAPLLQLPRSALPSRFGESLLLRIDQCFGTREEPLRAFHAGIALVSEKEWEHPIRDLTILAEEIQHACRDLCKKLEQCGHGVLRIACQLLLENQSIEVGKSEMEERSRAHVIQLSLFQASQDPAHLAWLLQGQIELHPPRMHRDVALKGLRLEANVTAPVQWKQIDLFADAGARHKEAAAKLIDALSARLGRNRVLAPSIVRDPIPENRVRMRPLTGLRPDGGRQETKRKLPRAPKRNFATESSLEPPEDAFLSRPSELVQPIRVEVETTQWGEPNVVAFEQRRWTIVASAGPERIESGWWSGPTQRREYYRVVLATGDWWWIYRDLRSMTWYLHGAFA
jgi:protein ImuB